MGLLPWLLCILHVSFLEAGICKISYICSNSVYESEMYTGHCEKYTLKRFCSRYRSVLRTYYRTCFRSNCCSGYTGLDCSQAICHGSTSCTNGGTCSSPNTCVCAPGFGGAQCQMKKNRVPGENHRPSWFCSQGRCVYKDMNECQIGICGQLCTNLHGSFTCFCRTGYTLNSDSISCTDIDECSVNNGGCSEYCRNVDGSYECYCKSGLQLLNDGKTCIDIDECSSNNGGCEQVCKNEHTTFRCECNPGFMNDADGKSCDDIDDCIGIYCLNDGSCLDFPEYYICKCAQGFEGNHCKTDIDECLYLNGGCEDRCKNTIGSFYCECRGNTTLEENGVSCRGDIEKPTVFQKHKIPRRLLPRGCAFIRLMSCQGVERGSEIILSSTSSWYQLKSNSSVHYTYGIVFAEVDQFSMPISISGLVVALTIAKYELFADSLLYRDTDGTEKFTMHDEHCLFFHTTPKDIYNFVSSGSFLNTIFSSLQNILPSWLQFSKSGVGLISVTDLKTYIVYGNKVDRIQECYGAPVFGDRLYSVFIFGSDMSLSLYGNRVYIPAPLENNKLCVIVDICQSMGGTIFLMFPEEIGRELSKVGIFNDLSSSGLTLIPRGIGLSLVKDINVHYKTSQMELWNGDEMINYRVFQSASVWLYTGIEYASRSDTLDIDVNGEAEIFLGVPSVSSLLLDLFMEEWNGILQFKHFNIVPTIRFDLLGLEIKFNIKAVASMEVYTSFGGHQKRIWCRNAANPPGIFVSFFVEINPFESIPLLNNWSFKTAFRIHAFVTTEENLSAKTEIDVLNDMIELQDFFERFRNLINDLMNGIIDYLSSNLQKLLSQLLMSTEELRAIVTNLKNGKTSLKGILNSIKPLWGKFTSIKQTVTHLLDELEFHTDIFAENFTRLLRDETSRIGRNLDSTINKITSKILSLIKSYTGIGFRFTAFVNIFSLEFSSMGVELVYSIKNLGQCNKFRKAYELLHGEPAIRVLATNGKKIALGLFMSLDRNVALSIAIGNSKFVVHAHIDVSVFGMQSTGDLFISNNGLSAVIECKIWNVFLARVTMSAELGRKWYDLTFALEGTFLTTLQNEGPLTATNSNFQSRYLTGLRLVSKKLAEEANKRLITAQNFLSSAKRSLTNAQMKIGDAQNYLRDCHSLFDAAIYKLGVAKQRVEDAKIPFEKALETLRKAQKNVDNLCRLKDCPYVCVPGVRCSWCEWGWFGYPCCTFTRCMFKIPNFVCEFCNLLCRGIRALAYIALEVAKIFVTIPMTILEVAKLSLTIAQIVVDKARVVLDVAEGILEIAKFGLEVVKSGLELAKRAIEVVKFTVKAGLYVFNLLVLGIQQLIDVKNCGFEIELSTSDKALFEVSCEVNAFQLGWTSFRFWFDFRHPVTSIWRIAKSTVKTLFNSVTSFLGKRKKRGMSFTAVSKMYHILRLYKRNAFDNSSNQSVYLNETIFKDGNLKSDNELTIEYNDRKKYFEHNCKLFLNVHAFFKTSVNFLLNISYETFQALNESTRYRNEIKNINSYSTVYNMTVESAGISADFAYNEYNLTIDDLNVVLEDAKINFKEDTVISEISKVTKLAYNMIDSGIDRANSIPLIHIWMLEMENNTFRFFDANECSNFQDCLQYAFSILYDLFSDESIEKTELNRNCTLKIENNILTLILNDSLSVQDMYIMSRGIDNALDAFMKSNMFCSSPPRFVSSLLNQTVLIGDNISLVCNVTGSPEPAIYWFFNGSLHENETNQELAYVAATSMLSGFYSCTAGNVVLNVTSDVAYIKVIECPPGTFYESGSCINCQKGTFQYNWNQVQCEKCQKGYVTLTAGSVNSSECYDIDECIANVTSCEQSCKNTNGSFICSCTWINELAADGQSCSGLSLLVKVMSSTVVGIAALIVVVIAYRFWKTRQLRNHKIRPSFINVCESIQTPPKSHTFILKRKSDLTSHN